MIGGQVSDPKLQRICAILQYTTFDGNGIYKSRYYRGIEGIHYTWEGEPEWSLMKTVPLDQQPRNINSSAISIHSSCGTSRPQLKKA